MSTHDPRSSSLNLLKSITCGLIWILTDFNKSILFVCVDALRPRQQFFSHVKMLSCLSQDRGWSFSDVISRRHFLDNFFSWIRIKNVPYSKAEVQWFWINSVLMLSFFACWVILHVFFFRFFSSKLTFSKILSGTLSECQIVWIQIWTTNCLQRLSADDWSHQ